MKKITLAQHQKQQHLPEGNFALVQPIYTAVKYGFDTYEALRDCLAGKRPGFFYSRVANPTVDQLEKTLAQMQGCEAGIATASGAAAITNIFFSLCQTGDHVVLFYESYSPTRVIVRDIMKKFGISHSIVSITDHPAIEKAFIPGKTKLVIFESPTNPMLRIADIDFITGCARKAGALTVLDNTFAGLDSHHGLGIDIYLHSLTKFVVGFGDAMGGIIMSRREIIDPLRKNCILFGANMDPRAANDCSRGIKTYQLRYNQQAENASALFEFLESHSGFDNICYPGNPKKIRDYALAGRQMTNFGTMIAFDIKAQIHVDKFINALKIVKVTGSLGSTETLLAPCELFYSWDLSDSEKVVAGIGPNSLRLSVGIEDPTDIIMDIGQAIRG